jgi:predicted enzyme related to lactoylglutathione lyase
MTRAAANPVVHLELHTANLSRACAFYTRLFGWRAERIAVGERSYLTLGLSDEVDGGVAERDADRCLWLPYVEVADVVEATERARVLGASVLLGPREGVGGWRSVVAAPAGAEIALWQPKAPAEGLGAPGRRAGRGPTGRART